VIKTSDYALLKAAWDKQLFLQHWSAWIILCSICTELCSSTQELREWK